MSLAHLSARISSILGCLALVACAQTPVSSTPGEALQQHTQYLAADLFPSRTMTQLNAQRIGIGSLVPVHSLRQEGNGRDRVMVQQIQEGLVSAAASRGAHIVEYRTSTQLRFDDGQELMLSREVKELSVRQRLDYFLTGTYSEVSGGLLVNLRLVNVRDNSVARAATHFFPWASIHATGEMSEIRYNQLYRHSTSPNDASIYRDPAPVGASRPQR